MIQIHPIDVILRKRNNLPLTDPQIQSFIQSVTTRQATDPQIAAFLMAVFLNGLNPQELATLTTAMRFSGETFDATPLQTFTIDKHSTGGVGDKTSLLIAPILAAAGLQHPTESGTPGIVVPMISGRSLGHTGGTLDKLETIAGFNTQLPLDRFEQILRQHAACLIGQTPTLVPADRILYALRDHTGTVESPYLITASIMSKKLAESLNALVLDVKCGSGAFMQDPADARHLANLMVSTGNLAGTRTIALLTQMDEPLGRFAGNWLEVWECLDILQNRRHPQSATLIQLTNILAGWMLHLAGHAETPAAGALLSDQILQSGAAYKSFLAITQAQGGDTTHFENPAAFHTPGATTQLLATQSGYLSSMDCTEVGWAIQRLGAGRLIPGAPVDPHAGLEVHTRLGDQVTIGQPLLTLHAPTPEQLTEPLEMLRATYKITSQKPTPIPLIRETITP